MAPPGIPPLLALEVEDGGPAAPAPQPPGADRRDGRRQSVLGQERIANELQLKLGNLVSPRTVAQYLRRRGPLRAPDPKQRWLTFVQNHAKVIVACDFFVVITATFRTLYVFVLMEVGTRRILHHNVTAHPTAEWTLQQFRETLPGDHAYQFVLHDRDSSFSRELNKAVTKLGVRVLRTPVRAPMANVFCERLGGSLRRVCLDFLIALHERHLRMMVKEWGLHDNRCPAAQFVRTWRSGPKPAESGGH